MSRPSSADFLSASETLPPGWTMTTGEHLFQVVRGVTYNKNEASDSAGSGKIPILRAGNIQDSRLHHDDLVYVPDGCVSTQQILRSGDLVVAMSSGSKLIVGKVGYVDRVEFPISFGAFCAAIRPRLSESADWLRWFFRTPTYRGYISEKSAGVNINNLKPAHLLELRIPLPPLPEQRRIVERLESLEARSRRAREKLAAIPAQLAQARQSLLAAAFRGDLTADWRKTAHAARSGHDLLRSLNCLHTESPGKKGNAAQATEGVHELDPTSLPSAWAVADLRSLCRPDRPICYGILMPGPELQSGVPYVRVADFPKDRIRLDTVRKTSPEIDVKFARSRLSTGDILLSIRGTVGRLAVVPPELDGANITQDSARLSIHASVSSEFVMLMLRSPDTLLRMQSAVKGVAVRGINIGDVRPLQIPLPSLPEQHEIVRRLTAAFARLDAAATAHTAAVAALDRLDQSLLARAFAGEI